MFGSGSGKRALLVLCVACSTTLGGDAAEVAAAKRDLASRSAAVRLRAVRTLVRIDGRLAVRALEEAVKEALREMDSLSVLIDRADEKHTRWMDRARRALRRGQEHAMVECVDRAQEALAESNRLGAAIETQFLVCTEAASGLARCRSPEAVAELARGAEREPHPLLRQVYVDALGREACRDAVPLLLLLLEDRDPRVRAMAVRSLHPFAREPGVAARAWEVLKEDEAWPARLGLYGLQARAPREEALPRLVEAASKESGELALAVDDYLKVMTGRSYADDPRRWHGWWRDNAAAIEAGTHVPAPAPPPRPAGRWRASSASRSTATASCSRSTTRAR